MHKRIKTCPGLFYKKLESNLVSGPIFTVRWGMELCVFGELGPMSVTVSCSPQACQEESVKDQTYLIFL